MSNKFEIVDVMSVPGRKDVLAVLKVISGDVSLASDSLSSPQLSGQWRIISTLTSNPAMLNALQVAVGLDGPLGLLPGMELVENVRKR